MVDLERGRGNLEILPVGIGHTVRRAAEAVQERARARGIKIRFVGGLLTCVSTTIPDGPRRCSLIFWKMR